MYGLNQRAVYISFHFLVLWCHAQGENHPSPNFKQYVRAHGAAPDPLSRRQVRVYQLYSRTSGNHVAITGRRVSATAPDGSMDARLLVETDTFGSRVRIRGAESGRYLCMNRKGKLVGKVKGGGSDCVFKEVVLENNYTAFRSCGGHVDWFVGFGRSGRPLRASRTRQNQREVHFIKRLHAGPPPFPNTPPGRHLHFIRLPATGTDTGTGTGTGPGIGTGTVTGTETGTTIRTGTGTGTRTRTGIRTRTRTGTGSRRAKRYRKTPPTSPSPSSSSSSPSFLPSLPSPLLTAPSSPSPSSPSASSSSSSPLPSSSPSLPSSLLPGPSSPSSALLSSTSSSSSLLPASSSASPSSPSPSPPSSSSPSPSSSSSTL